jgi:hypothetical protein
MRCDTQHRIPGKQNLRRKAEMRMMEEKETRRNSKLTTLSGI